MRKIKIGMNKTIPMDNGGGDRVMKLCQARLHMSPRNRQRRQREGRGRSGKQGNMRDVEGDRRYRYCIYVQVPDAGMIL
jgi:hypothetical protein